MLSAVWMVSLFMNWLWPATSSSTSIFYVTPNRQGHSTQADGNLATNPDLAWYAGFTSQINIITTLGNFPSSQHYPSPITITDCLIAITETCPILIQNFKKTQWPDFLNKTENLAVKLPDPTNVEDFNTTYDAFVTSLTKIAKMTLPCGFRVNCFSCWDQTCNNYL